MISPSQDCADVVRKLWDAFDRADFEAALPLLDDDFVCEWPQSRERIRGRDHFVAINRRYPGRWRISVRRLVASGSEVVTHCDVSDGRVTVPAISFFDVRNGRIARLVEYWPDPMEAQPWRAAWVERMEP